MRKYVRCPWRLYFALLLAFTSTLLALVMFADYAADGQVPGPSARLGPATVIEREGCPTKIPEFAANPYDRCRAVIYQP